jgi:4-alpha-glucanotransferase
VYHCYLQWLSETQLQTCQQLADKLGMEIGLIRDLAIGSQRNSAEVDLNPNLFAQNASIGAPPDPLAPQGQNWGLPPMKPLQLQQSGYHHFIELLQANMAHCKALRIDHVMGLMRLWWCAENKYLPNICETQEDSKSETKPSKTSVQNLHGEGAYVAYPVDELFAILRLESQRNHCLVIGEDLGIVPPEIRTRMASSGLFSNALFYFEKYDPVRFKVPQHFIPKALTMIANHDVPTLAAWWNKTDLATRSQIGLINSDEEFQRAVRERESDLIQIMHWLNDAGLLPDHWRNFNIHKAFDYDLCRALLQANARSASQLVSLQLEDLCLTESPVNIPGTSTEYPNWRRKVPQNLDAIFSCVETDTLISAFVQARTS